MIRKIILGALGLTLVIGAFFAGYVLGQAKLEREWRLPPMVLTEAQVSKLRADDANPVPPPGTKVLVAMPLERARRAVAEFTAKDPVRVTLGSVGRGDEGAEMSLVVKSDVPCAITSLEGTAYGFDSWGRSARLNRGGEHFVGFGKKLEGKDEIAAKAPKAILSWPMRHVEAASIALAQVDRYSCADGTKWQRN